MLAAFERLPADRSAAIVSAGVAEFSLRSYADANTERITAACGISKGLLYHYFGTKKEFYLYCLRRALDVLTREDGPPPAGDFYGVLFGVMERKMALCREHPAETKLVNMASRESCAEVRAEKDALFAQYAGRLRAASDATMSAAVAALPLRGEGSALAAQGLGVYTSALVNRYLLAYQETPEAFFARREAIQAELKTYIDLMLYGVCKEEA